MQQFLEFDNMSEFLKKYFPFIFLLIVLLVAAATNLSLNTFLIGWDNLLPEFNILLNIKRSIFSVWQNEAFGFLTGNANAAELPRQLLLLPLMVFPLNLVRQIFILLMLGTGAFGAYFLIRSLVRYENQFLNSSIPLLGSLFYLFNLATVQTFYAPFEPFVVHFAFLPWLLFSTLYFIAQRSLKSIIFFLIVNVLAIPQSQVPTIFIVYVFSLTFFLLVLVIETKRREIILSSAKILVLTFLINAFWLLPFLYFVFTNSGVAFSAKINQMSTQTVFLQNKEFGSLSDVILLKGFWFNNVDPNAQGTFDYMLKPWREHLTTVVSGIGFLLFGIILSSFTYIKKKKPFILPFFALFLLSFTMLAVSTPPFSWIDALLREVPLFGQVFRFPFTKFSVLAALTYSFFFAIGVGKTIEFARNKLKFKAANLLLIPIILLVLIFVFPIFKGQLFYNKERVNFPPEYQQVFNYFSKVPGTERIANFPQHTFWGWNYYKWGYGGSGFLWYSLPQPILDRAFDVWSRESENYYWEIQNALYLKNPLLFYNVIQKYNIRYLLLDKNVVSVNSQKSLHIPEFEETVAKIGGIKKDASFGKIDIYKVSANFSPIKTVKAKINGYNWGDYDAAYNEFGDYISVSSQADVVYPFRSLFSGKNEEDKEFKVQVNQDSIDFISKDLKNTLKVPKIERTFQIKDKVKNCDTFRNGKFFSKPDQNLLELNSKDATACSSFAIVDISPSQGYLLTVANKNIKGRPVHIWVVNEDESHTIIDTYFSRNSKLTTSYFVLPPQSESSRVYSFHFDNVSIGDESQNDLGKIALYEIPYNTLTSFKSKINGGPILKVLDTNQSYDPGWKAYKIAKSKWQITNSLNLIFPFVFGDELKDHVLLNNWANGFVLNDSTIEQLDSGTIVIIYLPQYLEYLGFLILFLPLIYLIGLKLQFKSDRI